jgi:ABC-type glycerol-3-phosphate transport system substrate-binding protein
MKKLSAFQIVLTTSFGALAVAGVLIFAFAVSSGNDSTVGPVTIWGTFDEGTVNRTLQQLTENDPDFAQVSYVQMEERAYLQRLTDALAAGSGPDIFIVRDDQAHANRNRVTPLSFESLSESRFRTIFIDGAAPFLGQSGVIALPFLADPIVLYWNRDILATAGYAQPPVYWGELYEMAEALTIRTDSGAIEQSAVHFGEFRNVSLAKMLLSMLVTQAGGTVVERSQEGTLVGTLQSASGGAAQPAINALRFYTEFADPSKIRSYSWNRSLPEAQTAFANGDLALYYGLASEESLIRQKNPNLNFSVTATTQINPSTSARVVAVGGYVYALAVPRTSANTTGAFAIANKLASAETGKVMSEALGLPSARRDVLAASTIDDLAGRQALLIRTWPDPDPGATDDVFRAMIEDVISGATFLPDAVIQADQRIDQILQRQP